MKIRAYIILCKSCQDGVMFASQQDAEWQGTIANFVWEFGQCRHYAPVPDDVCVVKTPAFIASPDEDMERALNVIPSWKHIRFVTMDGVLYPCLDIRMNVIHHDERPFVTMVFVLAFGLTVTVEATGTMIFEHYEKHANERYKSYLSIVVSGGKVVECE